jgi:plasmid stability protein
MRAAEVLDMSEAPVNVVRMSKMIQIRNVPDELHRALKVRAAAEGMSLSDYIKRELTLVTSTSKVREIAARNKVRRPSGLSTKMIVDVIRESRGE